MRYFLTISLFVFIFISFGAVKFANGQPPVGAGTTTTGTTTTPITTLPANADQVSDSQLRDLIQKAQASGMSDEQIRQLAISKGMSPADASKLQVRTNIIRTAKDANGKDISDSHKLKGDKTTKKDDKTDDGSSNDLSDVVPTVFGSSLFSNDNLTFEPNLNIPTPKNYILGPGDELIINIYGKSQTDWKPVVTPEGTIQISGIGLINVSGKTIEQATKLITSKLIANHYDIGNGTTVTISLGNIRSIKVIIVGEVVKPATYTLSSLSTVFNALYASGGPNSNGSFRAIEVIRDSKVIRLLDAYDFLLRGSRKDDIRLEDGDIIRVPTYKVHVTLSGQVKQPAIFEVLPGETLRDVINFAGGFTDNAYTSSIKAIQLTDKDKKVVDIKAADFDNYIPLRGDEYVVDRILDTYENRVSIYGSVVRAGQFELDRGLTLSQLIAKASGLRPDAFATRGFISRLRPDNTTELIPFDVKGIVNKTVADIPLKKEDVVIIPSIFDLRDQYSVSINGEVRNPGQFTYSENMSVADLVIQAGGFTESASPKRVEIARRINYADPNQKNSPIASISTIDVDEKFQVEGKPFILQPFDVVFIYTSPGYEKQKIVNIEGEVLYPGPYPIETKDEKLSHLVKRAGGLTASADVESGTLKRTNILGVDEKQKVNAGELEQEKIQRIQHIEKTLKDSTSNADEQLRNDLVGIDLKKILSHPGSKIDLILEEGDVLRIPKQRQLVSVNGEVLYPSSVVYESSKTFRDFVDNAGGFSPEALRRRAYVVYANGSVKSTHTFLFIKSYPQIKPGSEIIIPKKPERKGLSATEIGGITATLASAAAVLIGIISLVRH